MALAAGGFIGDGAEVLHLALVGEEGVASHGDDGATALFAEHAGEHVAGVEIGLGTEPIPGGHFFAGGGLAGIPAGRASSAAATPCTTTRAGATSGTRRAGTTGTRGG